MEGYLEDIFLRYLKVNEDFYISIDDVDFDVTDGVLICSMELYTLEDISEETFENTPQSTVDDNQENIEELELNLVNQSTDYVKINLDKG